MNNRIKQLVEQAGITANNLSDGNMSSNDLEKFAELIVAECVAIAYEHNNSGEGGVVAEQIKQHFGVEE